MGAGDEDNKKDLENNCTVFEHIGVGNEKQEISAFV